MSNNTPLPTSDKLIEVTVPSHINPYRPIDNTMSSHSNMNYFSPINNNESYLLQLNNDSFNYSHQTSTKNHPYKPKKERRHRKQPHELLSEEQKKANHIASEQKRRQNIKIGYDQLIDIVPSLNHGNKSEALILQKSVDHIRHLISQKNQLKHQVRQLQNTLGETNLDEDSSEDELLFYQ